MNEEIGKDSLDVLVQSNPDRRLILLMHIVSQAPYLHYFMKS